MADKGADRLFIRDAALELCFKSNLFAFRHRCHVFYIVKDTIYILYGCTCYEIAATVLRTGYATVIHHTLP